MKILITGAAGFLGLHLVKHAKKIKNKAIKLFLLDIADFEEEEYPKNCIFIKADVRDKKYINLLFKNEKFDYVIHAAAALPLWKKEDIFSVNVNGTKNILSASSKNNVKRVIFISSTAVYGVPKKHPIEESDQLIGVGAYGESKIQAEKICFLYIKKGLNVTIIRPKTFVGPYRLGVFEILFDWVYDGKKIPIIGSGQNRYQLLDVEDLVEVIYRFIISKNKSEFNDIFNVGAVKFGTVKEDLEELFNYAYKKRLRSKNISLKIRKKSTVFPTPACIVKKLLCLFEKLKISPLYKWVYDTADKDSYVSLNKIKKVLDWQPKYSNAQALIRAYQWYLDNYQKIKSKPAGITHRVGWKQGILGWFKKFL